MSTTPPARELSRKRNLDDTNDDLSARSARSIRSRDSSYNTSYWASTGQPNRSHHTNGGPHFHHQNQRGGYVNQDNGAYYRDRGRERYVSGGSQQFRQGGHRRNDNYERGGYNEREREREREREGERERYPPRRQVYDNNRAGSNHHLPPPLNASASKAEPPVMEKKTKSMVEDEIKELEAVLKKLENVPSIDDIKVIDSRWGIKPKGFEQVSAPRAKLSGLFPLPGFPRPVDFTKLEGLIKDRLTNRNDILNETSKIDPVDSRVAKTLIINNIEEINYLKIVEFFNDYLKMIDFEQGSTNNIHSKRKLNDEKTLIIEFNNSECTTIIFALNGTQLLFNAYKRDDVSRKEVNEKFKLQISRPKEYVVQDEGLNNNNNNNNNNNSSNKERKEEDEEDEEVLETVSENPRKISLVIASSATSDYVREELVKNIAPLRGMRYYRQKGTKEPLGLVFVEFKREVEDVLSKLKNLPFVENASFACLGSATPIQQGTIDYYTLPKLVCNETVQPHIKSNVIQLINVLSTKDLLNDGEIALIAEDVRDEASKYGKVVSMKIPRPVNDLAPGFQHFKTPGLGKIFIEYQEKESAFQAIMELSGRSYNDRTVLATYFDCDDYRKGLL
ncbi:hypothetical protein KGF56_002774 [Candida oxycetoniae]|uniref:RNA recognition motif domain-containing protein n=1 Tax=Candida oxycetoniae TaxID=497107 RepID=A0AAI9WXL7_9ASCO|nr:uncharacterized protein KGF56_002774 [Candida oxycetoniae]KAI3404377.2 hypothetical protein KGF56_002774 [Candida oxycetoniae]